MLWDYLASAWCSAFSTNLSIFQTSYCYGIYRAFVEKKDRVPASANILGVMKRIYSIDLMRGIVMIIMALDHVRDLMHTTSITQSPTNLATTTTALFATRWITHLC